MSARPFAIAGTFMASAQDTMVASPPKMSE